MADERERWLAIADNRGEWQRLCRALELESGFALFVVDVPDAGTEARVVALLGDVAVRVQVLDARATGEDAAVRVLSREHESLAVLCSVEASRRDIEALERCLVQLNARRDQIAMREQPLVIVLRRDAVERMIDVAPDLYSVHRARFRFARLQTVRAAPPWLLTTWEFAALVDIDGPFSHRVQHYWDLFDGRDPTTFRWPETPHSWLSSGSSDEPLAARILAHYEGLPELPTRNPADLAQWLLRPSLAVADQLRASLDSSRSGNSPYLTHLCALSLAWANLHEGRLADARAAIEIARLNSRGIVPELRTSMLTILTDAAEGMLRRPPEERLAIGRSPLLREYVGTMGKPAFELDMIGVAWAQQTTRTAASALRSVLREFEYRHPNCWRFDATLRSLPDELVRAAGEPYLGESWPWLLDRKEASDLAWPNTWVTSMMLARALDAQAEQQQLLQLAQTWLATPERRDIYDVWRVLVDLAIEANDTSTLARLIEMPLAPMGEHQFGPQLPAALYLVGDTLARTPIELPNHSHDTLRARAAAREGLSLAMRVGWWAIEQQLERRSE